LRRAKTRVLGEYEISVAQTAPFDLAVIGGGINGCGIARDAAGRGWRVHLCERGDLGSATPETMLRRLMRTYGTRLHDIVGPACRVEDGRRMSIRGGAR
jgi:pyruvate/2-oxoglutarate dehydrogenase complex dihydrolipoamide dehydrogenase (E3) component